MKALLDKKLSIVLRTLLVLEAIAKVVFIVKANLMQNGSLLTHKVIIGMLTVI